MGSLLTTSDWDQISASMLDIRDDNSVNIVIRRGSAQLSAQTVRVAGVSNGSLRRSDGSSQSLGGITVLGSTTLDIRVGDRFSLNGILHEVEYVHPNRRVKTQARAKAME